MWLLASKPCGSGDEGIAEHLLRALPRTDATRRRRSAAGTVLVFDAEHDLCGLHEHGDRQADLETEIFGGVLGDGRGDALAAVEFDDDHNRYWPARYLISATGQVRLVKLGEGAYDQTENAVRTLLKQINPGVALPAPGEVPDTTPADQHTTKETYLSHAKLVSTFVSGWPAAEPGDRFGVPVPGGTAAGRQGRVQRRLDIGYGRSTAKAGAQVRLGYVAKTTNLVLAERGMITVSANGEPPRTIEISGTPNLYQLTRTPDLRADEVTVSVSPGLQAYAFTFD